MSYLMQSTGMPSTQTISTSSGYVGVRHFLSSTFLSYIFINKEIFYGCLLVSRKQWKREIMKYGYHAKYKVAHNQVTHLSQRAKEQYFQQLNPNDPKSFWKHVKYANNNKPSIPVLQCDGVEYVTDQEKAQKRNSYFSSCFNPSHPPLLPTSQIFHADQQMVEDLYRTVDEVEHALQCLVSSKASGPDKISAKMPKYTAPSIAPSITDLFNCSLCSGRLPDEWKTSMIVPIPKGSTKSNPANYHPISLICILCKLI